MVNLYKKKKSASTATFWRTIRAICSNGAHRYVNLLRWWYDPFRDHLTGCFQLKNDLKNEWRVSSNGPVLALMMRFFPIFRKIYFGKIENSAISYLSFIIFSSPCHFNIFWKKEEKKICVVKKVFAYVCKMQTITIKTVYKMLTFKPLKTGKGS